MRRAIGIVALLLIAALPCAAGFVTSSLTGRVSAGEQTLSGVRITVESPSLQQPRSGVTDSDGRYFIEALPPGDYQVTFELKGMQTLTRSAVVELGRVARADAQLQPSEDEESVTSTAKTTSVVDTTAITSHFSREDLDRLPLWAGPLSVRDFAPVTIVDGLLDESRLVSAAIGYDAVDQETVVRGALPAELESSYGGVIAMRTRSGGEDFSLSVRDSYFDSWYGSGHFFESESGGRIVPGKLWFFAGGWSGKDPLFDDADGFLIKLTGQPWASHNFVASHLSSDWSRGIENDHGTSTTVLRYTGVAGSHVAIEAMASRASDDIFLGFRDDQATARLSYSLGSHVLSGGVANVRRHPAGLDKNETSGFLRDRWAWRNLTLDAGLRLDGSETNPRLAATYDLHGNGRQAIAASYGSYDVYYYSSVNVEMTTLGFITALGNEGTARIDAIRRDEGGQRIDQLQLDSRYRLFDRFELGAVWSSNDTNRTELGLSDQIGRVWAGAQLPIGSHELGFTVSESYADEWGTDLAVRYMFPFRRVAFTLGGDAIDVFDSARALRFWARVRM